MRRSMPRLHLALFLCLLATLPCLPGFVCASRVERLEGEVDALRLQFVEIQQRINDDQAEITAMLLRADAKLSEIEDLQRKYQDVLSQGILDVQLELDQSRAETAELRGRLDLATHNLRQLESNVAAVVQTLGMTSSGQAVTLPQDADGLYAYAEKAFATSSWDLASLGYQAFVKNHGNDSRVEDALFKLAQSLQKEGRHVEAIGVVRQFLSTFPQSKRVNDAIWIMAESAEARGDCAVSKLAYEQLKGTSSHGTKATSALKRLKSTCP